MKRWTADEEDKLRRMAQESCTSYDVGEALGRTGPSVSSRAERLGIRFGPPKTYWTAERQAELQRLAGEGLSARMIGELLGVSRSAIIGRAHRTGVNVGTRSLPASHADRAAAMRMEWRRARRAGEERPKPAPKPKAETQPWQKPVPPPEPVRLVSFDDLTPAHCKWPYGDPKQPGFGFCGQHRVTGSSYCAGHRALSIGNGTPSERAAVREAGRVAA